MTSWAWSLLRCLLHWFFWPGDQRADPMAGWMAWLPPVSFLSPSSLAHSTSSCLFLMIPGSFKS